MATVSTATAGSSQINQLVSQLMVLERQRIEQTADFVLAPGNVDSRVAGWVGRGMPAAGRVAV